MVGPIMKQLWLYCAVLKSRKYHIAKHATPTVHFRQCSLPLAVIASDVAECRQINGRLRMNTFCVLLQFLDT